jgi:hypothetical protein
MSIIMSVVMSILDEYPGARAKMVAAIEQFRLMLHDRGGSTPSTPGAAGDGRPDAGRDLATPALGGWTDGF